MSVARDRASVPDEAAKTSRDAAQVGAPDAPVTRASDVGWPSGLGDCAVCGRRHGRPCDAPPPPHSDSGHPSYGRRGSGRDGGLPSSNERQQEKTVYLEDCVRALEAAVGVCSTIYGGDAQETMDLREGLEGVKALVERALTSSKN